MSVGVVQATHRRSSQYIYSSKLKKMKLMVNDFLFLSGISFYKHRAFSLKVTDNGGLNYRIWDLYSKCG